MGFLYFIFSIWVLHFHTCDCRFHMENTSSSNEGSFTLDSVREALVRMEDTIVFNLIERAKFPHNSVIYDASSRSAMAFSGSMLEFLVKETESVQAKIGRYESPEENPFFPNHLPRPLTPPHNYPKFLHPSAASVNINSAIWNMYVNELLPLFATEGDDGNYVPTAASDLECLQILSRRIHYGKFVAEVKFRDAPEDYRPAIRDQDKDALMKLLTFESVEEMVKRRVEKKAMVYGQEVTLADEGRKGSYKLDPSVLSRLYGEWVMPLTKLVQVEYLLRRLD